MKSFSLWAFDILLQEFSATTLGCVISNCARRLPNKDDYDFCSIFRGIMDHTLLGYILVKIVSQNSLAGYFVKIA